VKRLGIRAFTLAIDSRPIRELRAKNSQTLAQSINPLIH
jgi:hypothetical protein